MTISLRDIAKKAGVSVGTASNVLNRPGIVSPETAKRVHQVIEELGYNPNGYVKQMTAGHSRTLGLVVPNVSNPFFAEVARGVEDAAAKKNYAVFICNTGESHQREERFMSVLIEQMVKGVLITPTSLKPGHIKMLKERGISVTLSMQPERLPLNVQYQSTMCAVAKSRLNIWHPFTTQILLGSVALPLFLKQLIALKE